MTFDEIVADYIREYREAARTEMRLFEIQRSPSVAIRKAALCELPSGKRHPHQWRIPKAILEQAEARLQAIRRKLAKADDFAALHGLVEGEIGSIKGIGALTVYDIAHRVGAHFGKAPMLVYLHAGTRMGARVFNISGDSFDPRILPNAFSRMTPSEIEDCLCIYKDELRDGAHHRTARRKSGCDISVRQR
ncbi:MAG TPA: hypothetical protein VFK06_11770 [Candidatus Angelobacter sp.]|nr:hypothetical protein [Candidatus Angelobacter sp.]